ncbi:MAG: archease [Nitrososphaerota archaeon]|jgi:SHS2 domain-containing protein|uniref:archease n=1 Tax=Candidatus Bathycorpusculum sp. TaxID=2994959 RepID=UPI00282BB27E|nr:archease [Candidatus Termiticorpusculum sp.]MCL2257978.1 archease [Candidatus Termiticorpusculum sp.]MCL2291838.1 archease [Candidatus Termiticorpusculum sp.]MDR0459929.1 archease [Nitrososphaerota archaeon]
MCGKQFEGRFEFLEHTADVYVKAFGVSLGEAFENAALALFETMTKTGKVDPIEAELITVEADDLCALLYNWLEVLLVSSETKGMLYSKFQVNRWIETAGRFKFSACVWGEKFQPEKHVQKVAVKAVTYHRMVVMCEKIGNVVLEFILDI